MAAAMACVALAAVVLIVQNLRTPVGRKVDQTLSTRLSGAGFLVFLALVTLSHFSII